MKGREVEQHCITKRSVENPRISWSLESVDMNLVKGKRKDNTTSTPTSTSVKVVQVLTLVLQTYNNSSSNSHHRRGYQVAPCCDSSWRACKPPQDKKKSLSSSQPTLYTCLSVLGGAKLSRKHRLAAGGLDARLDPSARGRRCKFFVDESQTKMPSFDGNSSRK